MTAQNVIDLIGNTPLLRVQKTVDLPEAVSLSVKAEWFNPGGSVKDRAAHNIVRRAWAEGRLAPGATLLDSSSGNTGIAYAMLGAAMGFRVVLCIPKNANQERMRTLRAYGAELVLTDPALGSDGAIEEARRMLATNPDRYFFGDQYNNDANWQAHFESTGPELDRQTEGRLTHFVVGLGTSGTCMGVTRYCRAHLPEAKVIACEPDSPFHGLEGWKHMASAIVPGIYDATLPDEIRPCRTEDGYRMAKRVAQRDGIFLGISSGACLHVAAEVAKAEAEAGRAATVVALAPDGGSRYLSEHFWDED